MNITLENAKRCVGPGWSKLIEEIWEKLPEDTYISQIKEKYGGLRFYTGGISRELSDYILSKEEESYTICEMCGELGEIRKLPWIQTLCETHYQEALDKYKNR